MPLNNSNQGLTQVSSANADISVANGTTAPALTLNSGTGANQIVKLDNSAKLPALNASQLTDIYSTSDVAYLNQQQLIQNIDILRCLAHASLSISDYSTMFCDLFSDSNGYSNTLDTGNTDAVYNPTTQIYKNAGAGTPVTRSPSLPMTSTWGWGGAKMGWKFAMGSNDRYITKITKPSDCDATKAYVYAGNKSTKLAEAYFSGDNATLASPILLSASTTYYFLVDKEGSSGTCAYTDTSAFPFNLTDGQITASSDNAGNDGTNQVYGVKSIDLAPAASGNKIVQTNTIVMANNLTGFQLYCKKTLAGSATLQYKISFDNGSTWSVVKELNTKYTNSTTGTNIKLQLLLNGTEITDTAEVENYSLMVWY